MEDGLILDSSMPVPNAMIRCVLEILKSWMRDRKEETPLSTYGNGSVAH